MKVGKLLSNNHKSSDPGRNRSFSKTAKANSQEAVNSNKWVTLVSFLFGMWSTRNKAKWSSNFGAGATVTYVIIESNEHSAIQHSSFRQLSHKQKGVDVYLNG